MKELKESILSSTAAGVAGMTEEKANELFEKSYQGINLKERFELYKDADTGAWYCESKDGWELPIDFSKWSLPFPVVFDNCKLKVYNCNGDINKMIRCIDWGQITFFDSCPKGFDKLDTKRTKIFLKNGCKMRLADFKKMKDAIYKSNCELDIRQEMVEDLFKQATGVELSFYNPDSLTYHIN